MHGPVFCAGLQKGGVFKKGAPMTVVTIGYKLMPNCLATIFAKKDMFFVCEPKKGGVFKKGALSLQ